MNPYFSQDQPPSPPGKTKIQDALRLLLAEKEFLAITTAQIASQAGVTEALIYKYFQDKRDLLHQVLAEYIRQALSRYEMDLKGIQGAVNKLRKIIWSHIHLYMTNRVFAKILLIEVRNHPDYYKSDTYKLVRLYSDIVLNIITEGQDQGEIRGDLPAQVIRQGIHGAIEQVCLSAIILNRDLDADRAAEDLCTLIFEGITTQK